MRICLLGSGNPFGTEDGDEDEVDMPSMNGSDSGDDDAHILVKARDGHDSKPIVEVKLDVDNDKEDKNDMPAIADTDTSSKDFGGDGGVPYGDSDDDEDEEDMPTMSDVFDNDDDENDNDISRIVDTHGDEDETGMPPNGPPDTADLDPRYAGLRAQRAIARTYGAALDELQCTILCSGACLVWLRHKRCSLMCLMMVMVTATLTHSIARKQSAS